MSASDEHLGVDIPGEGTGRVRKQSKSSKNRRKRSRSRSKERRGSKNVAEEGGAPLVPSEPAEPATDSGAESPPPAVSDNVYSGGNMDVKTSNPDGVESGFTAHDAHGAGIEYPADVLFDFVMVVPNQEAEEAGKNGGCCAASESKVKNRIERRNKIMAKLEKTGFITRKAYNADESQMIVEIGAKIADLEKWAEEMELSVQLREEHGGRYTEFTVSQRHMFRPSLVEDTVFTSSERQQIVYKMMVQPEALGGCNLNIGKLIAKGVIVSAFPLHNEAERVALREKWLKGWRQPLNDVKDYYGESIAFYFAWLGFYTKWLWLPAIIGIVANIWLAVRGGLYENNPSPITPFVLSAYAVFMMLWATAFTEFWKRKQSKLAYRWDVLEYRPTDHHRPQFYGEIRPSPVTGRPELFYPRWKYLLKMSIGASVVGILIGVSIFVMGQLVADRARLQAEAAAEEAERNPDDPPPEITTEEQIEQIWFSFQYSIVLVISELVFTKIAAVLTDWENHATDHDYENNLILKTFFFQLINSFIALYFYAFFTGNSSLQCELAEEKDESCSTNVNVIRNLSMQLFTTMMTRTVVGNIKEYVQPLLMRIFYSWSSSGQKKKGTEMDHELSQAEKEANMPPYYDTFQDYAELILQYGFVTFFSATFPAGPMIALINNVYEIRGDASKLLDQHQRPRSITAPNIGTWLSVLEGMSVLAIMTNALLLAFSTKSMDRIINSILGNEDLTADVPAAYVFISAVVIEHVVLLLKFLLTVIIPDMSNSLKIQIAKEDFEKAQLLGLKSKYDTNDNEADEEDLEVRESLLPGLF